MDIAEIEVSYTNLNPVKVKIQSSQDVYGFILKNWDAGILEYKEVVKLILLNNGNFVIGIHELSRGGINSSIIDVRLLFGVALKCNASNIILVHNHPSGNLKPSEPDKSITKKVKVAGEHLDINLLDHLIITKESYYSFNDECLL